MDIHKIFAAASSLSSIQRYSQTFLTKGENVLEHTGFVVMFCYFVGKYLISKGIEINMGLLLSKAFIHDIDEIITGDVPRPTKYFSTESISIFKKMEQIGTRLFLEDLVDDEEILESIYSDWESSKSGVEGGIVKLADFASVIYKSWEEQAKLGNKSLSSHIIKTTDSLSKFDEPKELSEIKQLIIKESERIIRSWK